MASDYSTLCRDLVALVDGVPHPIANLANAAALLWQELEDLNWAGFYLSEGDRLVLGPFQGKPACIEIPYGKGVCGTAAEKQEAVVVEDVHEFPGHIACDEASRSEIVIPMTRNGVVFAVLDLDSPTVGRFTQADRAGLEVFVRVLEKALFPG
jgi:GAF domain-containing protein